MGELKLRSFQERSSSSEIINYVLREFLEKHPARVRLSRYQPHNRDEDRLGRTVYFQKEIWEAVKLLSKEKGFSISGLIEYLLNVYLGLIPAENETGESLEEKIKSNPERYVRMGKDVIDLGENPVQIDWKTGKPLRPE